MLMRMPKRTVAPDGGLGSGGVYCPRFAAGSAPRRERPHAAAAFADVESVAHADPAAELPVVRKLLRPDGALYLFYQPPNPAQLKPLATKVVRNLVGLIVDRTVFGPNGCLCLIAHAGKEFA